MFLPVCSGTIRGKKTIGLSIPHSRKQQGKLPPRFASSKLPTCFPSFEVITPVPHVAGAPPLNPKTSLVVYPKAVIPDSITPCEVGLRLDLCEASQDTVPTECHG